MRDGGNGERGESRGRGGDARAEREIIFTDDPGFPGHPGFIPDQIEVVRHAFGGGPCLKVALQREFILPPLPVEFHRRARLESGQVHGDRTVGRKAQARHPGCPSIL